MKRSELLFAAILVPLDFLMLFAAAFSIYYIRFQTDLFAFRPQGLEVDFHSYTIVLFLFAPFLLIVLALSGLYNLKTRRSHLEMFFRVFTALSSGFMAIVVFMFFQRELLFSSRFLVVSTWLLGVAFITIGRIIIVQFQRYLYRFHIGVHRTVIIGNSQSSEEIVSAIEADKHSPFNIVARLEGEQPFVAYRKALDQLIRYPGVDDIIQCDSTLPNRVVLKLIQYSDEHKIDFMYTPDLYETHTANVSVRAFAGIPIIELKRTPLDGWGKIIKRLMDIVVSAILLVLVSPILLITAIVIKLTSSGPIFFSRLENGDKVKRVGQYGNLFHYFKFRSMVHNAHSQRAKYAAKNLRKGDPLMKIQNDPRITPIGKIIRRFSIDELPEFWLVLKGDMSLVGPRPHLPEEVAKYKKEQRDVLRIKPGITGMAQVHGRSDLSFDEEVRLDVYYIENWSLRLDFLILLKTIPAVFRKRAAL
jgi:exopolysaccharide biosynthesis polyprenyl glycosylphosphotransferase